MTHQENNQTWYTLAEAKNYTRLSESLLRQAITAGRLKSTRSSAGGSKLILHKNWLDEMLMKGVNHE